MARWTVSPVFIYECAIAARRWQTYAGRVAFLAALLASLLVAWIMRIPNHQGPLRTNDLAYIGETFFLAIAGTQLVLALLAAPAYLAASICVDKTRGTLTHMLVTDLSATEIVVGKLGARALPVFGMLVAGVPVLVMATLLGGIEPWSVVASFWIIAAVALVTCALTLAFSVWASKPHEVLLATYVVEAIWLLAWPTWDELARPAPDWIKFMNPFHRLFGAVIWDELGPIGECAVFFGILTALAGLLTFFAVLTLRYAAQRGGLSRASRWRLPRMPRFVPNLDWNPVLWREWQRRAPSHWLRVIWGLYVLGCLIASLAALGLGAPRSGDLGAFVNAFQFSIGLLLVSITSVAALFEERVNGSFDVLLATPLTTSEIVWGKWLAGFRVVVMVSLLPTLLGFVLCLQQQEPGGIGLMALMIAMMLAYGAMVNSLGLALATRVKRFGVAMGLTVTIYVVLAAGPTLILLASRGITDDMRGFACLSPWYGVGETTAQITHRGMRDNFGVKIFWIVAYAATAFALIAGTLRIFDRCVGRAASDVTVFGRAYRLVRRELDKALSEGESS